MYFEIGEIMKNNKLRKLTFIGLSILLVTILTGCNGIIINSNNSNTSNNSYTPNEDKSSINFNILEFNDVHGYIEQDSNNKRGLSNAAKIVNDIRNDFNKTINESIEITYEDWKNRPLRKKIMQQFLRIFQVQY